MPKTTTASTTATTTTTTPAATQPQPQPRPDHDLNDNLTRSHNHNPMAPPPQARGILDSSRGAFTFDVLNAPFEFVSVSATAPTTKPLTEALTKFVR